MELLRGLKLAWRTVARNRLRSLLMMLGVLVGVASLTALAVVGESARRETLKRFRRMVGTFDTVIVRPGANRSRGMPSLTNVEPSLKFEDARAVAAEVPGVRRVTLVQNAFDVDVRSRDQTATPALFGVSANWPALRGDEDEIAAGSFLSEDDVDGLARVAVLGADAAAALFPGQGPGGPLGQTVRIGDVPFQVKGVLRPRGAGPAGGSLDNLLYIPVTTASRRLFNRDFLTMAIAQLRDPSQSTAAMRDIRTLLRERHQLAAAAPDDFTLISPRAAFARITAMGSVLSRVLAGVAVLATLIGGMVIMSLMLIGVAERRREIGVRRSVGASRRDILLQFLLEALVVSGSGGLAGALLGLGATQAVLWLQKLPAVAPWGALGWAAVISVALGLGFGVHPAWKAARVDPVAALRS
jgi:putative ABC transport system permease protein